MKDLFEQLGEQQIVAATRRKHAREEKKLGVKLVKSDKEAPMVLAGLEKKQAENSKQWRSYRREKRREYRSHLNGPYRAQFLELTRVLRTLTIDDGAQLIDYVRRAAWLRRAEKPVRQMALSIIAKAIERLRVRNGYEPFDDSNFGEEPTAFEIIREHLR